MQYADLYEHYKGGEYFFDCIALPVETLGLTESELERYASQTARYHENTHDMQLYYAYGVTFIDSKLPHVIYQAEKDYETSFVWAREVDNFFGNKILGSGQYVRRFLLKK